ncbi:MAG: hypothetical protein Q9170_004599 [Blastenia crenularia]
MQDTETATLDSHQVTYILCLRDLLGGVWYSYIAEFLNRQYNKHWTGRQIKAKYLETLKEYQEKSSDAEGNPFHNIVFRSKVDRDYEKGALQGQLRDVRSDFEKKMGEIESQQSSSIFVDIRLEYSDQIDMESFWGETRSKYRLERFESDRILEGPNSSQFGDRSLPDESTFQMMGGAGESAQETIDKAVAEAEKRVRDLKDKGEVLRRFEGEYNDVKSVAFNMRTATAMTL